VIPSRHTQADASNHNPTLVTRRHLKTTCKDSPEVPLFTQAPLSKPVSRGPPDLMQQPSPRFTGAFPGLPAAPRRGLRGPAHPHNPQSGRGFSHRPEPLVSLRLLAPILTPLSSRPARKGWRFSADPRFGLGMDAPGFTGPFEAFQARFRRRFASGRRRGAFIRVDLSGHAKRFR
jgi:hypothetical protein